MNAGTEMLEAEKKVGEILIFVQKSGLNLRDRSWKTFGLFIGGIQQVCMHHFARTGF